MRYIIILFFTFFISSKFFSQESKEVIISNMYQDVNYLASDKLKGRKTGTKGEKKAAKYIKRKFKKHGLKAKGNCDYYQKFQGKINYHQTSELQKGFNVIGFCNNNKDKTIIIGAHYDHIGLGESGSLHDGERQIHNGADDNASGVSILLNLVDELCENQLYNYLFIAFSGEEEGLLGSSYFAKNPTIDLNKVKFMLNFDMVGRLNESKELAINGTGTCNKWEDLLNNSNNFDLKLITSESGVGPSDHSSFYWQNIPSIHFFTGQHSDYHKPSDDIEKINFEGMYLIHSFVTKIIKQSYYIQDFDFQETTNNNTQTPKFNVTLGIMPDYLFNGIGLRIDGVTKEKTAFKYGIMKGDIILKVGDLEIKDIMDYMKALGKFKKGEQTNLKVKREEQIMEIAITFL